jgi:hypothetical protein
MKRSAAGLADFAAIAVRQLAFSLSVLRLAEVDVYYYID